MAAAAIGLSSCSSNGATGRAPSANSGLGPTRDKRAAVRVESEVLVREASKHDPTPIVCDRADGIPGGNTCIRVPVMGIDWDRISPHDFLGPGDVDGAYVRICGVYDDHTITIDRTPEMTDCSTSRRDPIDPRCDEPSGGWASQRGAAISLEAWDDLVQSLAADS